MADLEERIRSARLLAKDRRIRVSAIEHELGTVYTADTLKALKRRFPSARFVWLMGSDNLVQIARWRRWQTIFDAVPVVVVTRPGTALAAGSAKAAQRFRQNLRRPGVRFASARAPAWTVLEARHSPASATALRVGALEALPHLPFL